MDVYEQIIEKIIEGQEAIIGPVALELAERVGGLTVDWPAHSVDITSADKVAVIDTLIEQYSELFGNISQEVSKEAAASLMSKLPSGNLPLAFR